MFVEFGAKTRLDRQKDYFLKSFLALYCPKSVILCDCLLYYYFCFFQVVEDGFGFFS